MFEGQFTGFIVIGVNPAKATIQGIFTDIFQKPVKPFVENLAQSIRVTLILTVQGEGLAHKVVGFLIHIRAYWLSIRRLFGRFVTT